MAATATVTITAAVSGIGNDQTVLLQFSPTAPTASQYGYKQLGSANKTAGEPIDLDVTVATPKGLWIKAVDKDMVIDTTYGSPTSSFNARLNLTAGQAAYFVPTGTVWVRGASTSDQPFYEFLIFG